MPRETRKEHKAYRVVIVTQCNNRNSSIFGRIQEQYYGPHTTLRQARQIRTRECNEIDRHSTWWDIVHSYIERADNWHMVLDTDRE